MVVKDYNPRPDGKKVIALTFDDGPSQYTDDILKILVDKGVKATFFDLGTQALAYADQEQAMLKDGMQVASHSNTHPYLPSMSKDDLRAEIQAGFANIEKASGVQTTVFRSPYGAFGADQWKDAAGLISMNVLWDIDSEDWRKPGVDQIVANVVNYAHNGAIALMHDGGGDRSEDIKALPTIIDKLKADGYTFVTIDELVQMCGYTVAKAS
nr:polysaccharide deacetylase family protein [Bifidobacterium choloepi]